MENPIVSAGGDFYATLPVRHDFQGLSDISAYRRLPDDWLIGTADIVGSTSHIAEGRYKAVNTVGAAVISAQINAAKGERFPYVFGGDGATFAFPSCNRQRVADALARVLRWALDEFGFEMRGAIVPLVDIRAAGLDVAVARYAASDDVDYAMFAGGGVAWAEREMKAGRYGVGAAPPGRFPDLSGLSCRWTPMRSKNGKILSIVVVPLPKTEPSAVEAIMREIVDLTHGLERDGHPVPAGGPSLVWPPEGLAMEAHARRAGGSLFIRKLSLYFETLLAYLLFRFRIRFAGFDPGRYMGALIRNADFRKYDDGLKMTIDSDAATRRRIEEILSAGREKRIVDYGLFEQDEAIMTCIVPSPSTSDHVHFVDGAAGGYTTAAMALKRARAA